MIMIVAIKTKLRYVDAESRQPLGLGSQTYKKFRMLRFTDAKCDCGYAGQEHGKLQRYD